MKPHQVALALAVVASIPAFVAFGLDKHKARTNARRIPERTLLALAWIGPPGAWIGAWLFRHKTRKTAFLVPLVLVSLLSPLAIGAALMVGLGR